MSDLSTLISEKFASTDNTSRWLGVEISLKEEGLLPTRCDSKEGWTDFRKENLNDAWFNRAHPARTYMKYCFRMSAGRLAWGIWKLLDGKPLVEYTGLGNLRVMQYLPSDKNCTMSHVTALSGAQIVIDDYLKDTSDIIDNDYGHLLVRAVCTGQPPLTPSITGDPTFFVDLRAPMSDLIPADPFWALTTANPWVGA